MRLLLLFFHKTLTILETNFHNIAWERIEVLKSTVLQSDRSAEGAEENSHGT